MPDITVLTLAAATFMSTNVDNLALLVGWLLSGRVAPAHVAAGYALSIAVVIFVSAVIGLSSRFLPVLWIGWLGLVPILLGIRALIARFRGDDEEDAPEVAGHGAMFGVAATLVANSVDTVIVFAPLLLDTDDALDPVLIGGLALMAVAWYALAKLLSTSAGRIDTVRRAAGWVAPLIMIAVGLYIISDTATDVLLAAEPASAAVVGV